MLLVLLNCLTESTFPSPSSYSNRIQPIIKKKIQIFFLGETQVGGGRSQGHPPLYETLSISGFTHGRGVVEVLVQFPRMEVLDKFVDLSWGPAQWKGKKRKKEHN